MHGFSDFLGSERSDMAACGLPVTCSDAAEKPFQTLTTNECGRFASALSWGRKSQEGTLLSANTLSLAIHPPKQCRFFPEV